MLTRLTLVSYLICVWNERIYRFNFAALIVLFERTITQTRGIYDVPKISNSLDKQFAAYLVRSLFFCSKL